MKRSFYLFGLLLLVCSCQHSYEYVETVLEPSLMGGRKTETDKDAEVIKEKNDTLAYLAAYQKFIISQKVFRDMSECYGSELLSEPKSFSLYNENGVDISDIFFATKESRESEIEDRILSMKNSIKESREASDNEKRAKLQIDSAKVAELTPYFTIKKDEFDPKAPVWYKPKSAPVYTDRNGIYCYFMTENGIPKNFRFRIQYYADNWLFFKKVQFSIDDNAYEYIPISTETDNGSGNIWEWFDEQVRSEDKELIFALSNAKSAKMKFIGRQYYDIKTITPQQALDIKRTIELYKALGGDF